MPFETGITQVEMDIKVANYYSNKISSCKKRNIEFALTFAEVKKLMKQKKCFYTGILLTTTQPGGVQQPTDFTIDRVDNRLGYVSGNVVACCHAANSFKGIVEGMLDILTIEQKGTILQVAADLMEQNDYE